jgi:hypothetical protein
MGIAIQRFDPDRIAAVGRLFPGEIDADPWIMFHGTSGFNAKSIERDGFTFQPNFISHDQIKRVTNVYEMMKWAGESGGGCAVLKPFSLDHDFLDGGRGLLFFAESSVRALLFATRDFSGGEKLRALRIAFRDLDSYLDHSEVRERHMERMSREFRSLTQLNAHPSTIEAARPVQVDVDWLRNEMVNLRDIRQIADGAYLRHDHGVVYALKMTSDDLGGLGWNGSMGIEAATPIPVSKIVAKIVVPPDYKQNLFAKDEERGRRVTLEVGLIAAIRARVR